MLSYSRLWLLLHLRGYSPRDIIHLAGISESTYRRSCPNGCAGEGVRGAEG